MKRTMDRTSYLVSILMTVRWSIRNVHAAAAGLPMMPWEFLHASLMCVWWRCVGYIQPPALLNYAAAMYDDQVRQYVSLEGTDGTFSIECSFLKSCLLQYLLPRQHALLLPTLFVCWFYPWRERLAADIWLIFDNLWLYWLAARQQSDFWCVLHSSYLPLIIKWMNAGSL